MPLGLRLKPTSAARLFKGRSTPRDAQTETKPIPLSRSIAPTNASGGLRAGGPNLWRISDIGGLAAPKYCQPTSRRLHGRRCFRRPNLAATTLARAEWIPRAQQPMQRQHPQLVILIVARDTARQGRTAGQPSRVRSAASVIEGSGDFYPVNARCVRRANPKHLIRLH